MELSWYIFDKRQHKPAFLPNIRTDSVVEVVVVVVVVVVIGSVVKASSPLK